MAKCLLHEAFYISGTWIDAKQSLYVGWVARCGFFANGRPLHNEHGNVTLVFSGEEFRDPGIPAKIQNLRQAIASDGASYLVH